jgi:hypothetical protein
MKEVAIYIDVTSCGFKYVIVIKVKSRCGMEGA